ncbi:MAG: adenylyl-sulfate kinase [Vulcanimicrobiota bacterium]
MDILRFTTAGSVDDGKSTLIGRLLLESKSIYQDQLEAVTAQSRRRGDPYLDLALFTDGLKAEREQKITIDVAYRYFSTPRRKFIIADCPGHLQYTRNMVTGASTAELAVVLVDARNGLVTQSKRHAFLSTLLAIPHLVVAINKMDLVGYSEEVFLRICDDFRDFASRLEVKGLTFIPISALLGDNVVEKSPKMPWFQGSTFLHFLETVNTGASLNLIDFRYPVQYVVRPHQDFRGFAGRVASGRVAVGDEVVSLPSGVRSKVSTIWVGERTMEEAFVGDSVVLGLADEIDVSRGDLLVRANNLPRKTQNLDTTLCWLSEVPLNPRQDYFLKLATREVQCSLVHLDYLIDVDTMHREEARPLQLNDLGRAQLRLQEPIYFDPYHRNREMGSFILIDPVTHGTVAAGMIRGVSPDLRRLVQPEVAEKPSLIETERLVSGEDRHRKQGHKGAVVWLTGLSGAGKSTLAVRLEKELFEADYRVMLLDGDSVRQGLCADLGFSDQDRRENNRRIAELSALLAFQGLIVIVAFISPFRAQRELARSLAGEMPFLEVLVDCSLEGCEKRDPKGFYARARRGEIKRFTGLDSLYERPLQPDLELDTENLTVEECVEVLMREVRERVRL